MAEVYTKIDDQNFKKTTEVFVNYEELKKQWQLEQNQIDNYMLDVNRHRANQVVLEEQMTALEAQGAKVKEETISEGQL